MGNKLKNKVIYNGTDPEKNLILNKEYTVKGMSIMCFSGHNSGQYYLIEDESGTEIKSHSRNFKGEVCLLSDEQKKESDERRAIRYKRMIEKGYKF